MSVKCPRCGTYTYNHPIDARIHITGLSHMADPVPMTYNGISLVSCLSCYHQFVVYIDKAVWPLTSPAAPDGVPEKVKEAYEDARLAHAAGAKIAALMAGRTTLIRFLRNEEAADLKELVERQIITPALYGGADQLRLWAAIAGHDDIEVDTFHQQEVEDILDYLATVLEAVYTHQARVDEYVRRTRELKDQSGAPDTAAAT